MEPLRFNIFNIWTKLFLALVMLIMLLALISPVQAAIIEVHQGDTVYQGETADLSLVSGWDFTLAYWNETSTPGDTPPALVLEVYEKLEKTVISPERFPVGTYYSWAGEWEDAGNNLAFYVERGPRPLPTPTPKVNTTDQVTNQKTNETVTARAGIPIKPIADLLIARGDPLTINLDGPARAWVFGQTDMIAPRGTTRDAVTFTGDETGSLSTGRYGVLIQYPGNNTIYEVTWNKATHELDSPYKAVEPRDVSGYQPWMILTPLREMVNDPDNSDDQIKVYTLEIQNPEITITGIDEIEEESKTSLIVRGYTNVKAGSVLKFVIDKESWPIPATLAKHTYATEALDEGPGNMRDFTIRLPLDYSELATGQHFITGITPQGSESVVSFHIYDIPAGMQSRPAHLRYIGGSLEAAVLRADPLVTITPELTATPTPEPTIEIIYITPTPEPIANVTAASTPVKIVLSSSGERIEGAEPGPELETVDLLTVIGLVIVAIAGLYLGGKVLYSWYRYEDPGLPFREIREDLGARVKALRGRISKPKPEGGGEG